MKSLIATVFLFALCFYLTAYSSEHLKLVALGVLFVAGLLATPLISVWMEGTFLQKQIKAAKIAFPFSALIFLLGYFFVIFIVMI